MPLVDAQDLIGHAQRDGYSLCTFSFLRPEFPVAVAARVETAAGASLGLRLGCNRITAKGPCAAICAVVRGTAPLALGATMDDPPVLGGQVLDAIPVVSAVFAVRAV